MFWWLAGPISQEVGRTKRFAGRRTVSFQMFCFDTKWPKITIIFVFNAMQLHVLKQKSVAKGVLCF